MDKNEPLTIEQRLERLQRLCAESQAQSERVLAIMEESERSANAAYKALTETINAIREEVPA